LNGRRSLQTQSYMEVGRSWDRQQKRLNGPEQIKSFSMKYYLEGSLPGHTKSKLYNSRLLIYAYKQVRKKKKPGRLEIHVEGKNTVAKVKKMLGRADLIKKKAESGVRGMIV